MSGLSPSRHRNMNEPSNFVAYSNRITLDIGSCRTQNSLRECRLRKLSSYRKCTYRNEVAQFDYRGSWMHSVSATSGHFAPTEQRNAARTNERTNERTKANRHSHLAVASRKSATTSGCSDPNLSLDVVVRNSTRDRQPP
jgi:hypothetical protein